MELLKKIKRSDEQSGEVFIYTEDQLMARLKFFIGICLALTLTGIVFVVLYSIIFVTQPLNAISPIDQKFFELIIPIATFLTGTLSGIMLAGNDKDAKMKALEAATKGAPASTPPSSGPLPGGGFSASASFGGANFALNKPSMPSSPSAGFTPSMPGQVSSFSQPSPSFGGTAAPAVSMSPLMSSTGKPMPIQDNEPEL